MSEQEFVSPIADIKAKVEEAAQRHAVDPYLVPWLHVLLIDAYSRGWDHGYDKGKEVFGGKQ